MGEALDIQSGADTSLSNLIAKVNGGGKRTLLSFDETITAVNDCIEQSSIRKMQEDKHNAETQNVVKDKQFYRDNMAFYKGLIRDTLIGENIATYYKTPDGEVKYYEKDALAAELASIFVGFDCLEEAIEDPDISDIYVIAYDCIFVEKKGRNEEWPKHFRSEKAYNNFLDRILRDAGKQLNKGENKIVDFEIYGNRGNAIIDMVSTKGRCLTMRKHKEDPITRDDLLKFNLMTEFMADMLGTFIEGETNLIYAGITGSGKTTTIRALLDYYIPKLNKRILVLEDTQELFLKNKHTVDLATVATGDPKTTISLRELNISALRMKPKYIVVGEVRGAEAESAVEGMETGHSTIFTMHGGNVWNVVNRLVTKYLMQMPTLGIEVVERIIGAAVDFVCIQDDIPGIGRRVTSCHQISYDFETGHIKADPICEFNFVTEDWDWLNTVDAEKARTMMRRGVDIKRIDAMNDYIRERIKSEPVNNS